MQVYILSLLVLCNDTSWNLWLGNCQWKSLPQELLQVQPWRVCDKLIQLHSAWRPTLLQAPPHSTHQGKRQLQPARGWQQVLLLILQLWCLDMLIWRMHFYWYLIDFLLWFFFVTFILIFWCESGWDEADGKDCIFAYGELFAWVWSLFECHWFWTKSNLSGDLIFFAVIVITTVKLESKNKTKVIL